MAMQKQDSLEISIVKVYNWQQNEDSNEYSFEFRSLRTNETIFSKNMQPKVINQQLIINFSFKIIYSSEEDEIGLRISRINHTQKRDLVTEIIINLNLLKEKLIQYYPFGQNDKVLKIAVQSQIKNYILYYPSTASDCNTVDRKFIQQKEKFISKINQKIHSGKSPKQQKKDNVFNQRLYGLLQEVKQLRWQRTKKSEHNYELSCSDYQCSQTDSFKLDRITMQQTSFPRERQLIKWKSQNVMEIAYQGNTAFRNKQIGKCQRFGNNNGYFKIKHRLNLKGFSIEHLETQKGQNLQH